MIFQLNILQTENEGSIKKYQELQINLNDKVDHLNDQVRRIGTEKEDLSRQFKNLNRRGRVVRKK